MTKHHLMKEDHSSDQCIYCNKNLKGKEWESFFHAEIHYKTITCECGKENWQKVDFLSSGHDSWDGIERLIQ